MGYGYESRCRNCGKRYEFRLGAGMRYPIICGETKEAALSGETGEDWQRYVAEHPSGVFNCENAVFACGCGGWSVSQMNDYYVPDDGSEFEPFFTDAEDFTGTIRRSEHLCPKCGKEMRRIDDEEIFSLKCGRCGGELEFGAGFKWD